VLSGVANDVLQVGDDVLLPMVEDCIRSVDLDAGRIVVARGFAD
jgi:ribosomal 30S subunit maturation factor RimM